MTAQVSVTELRKLVDAGQITPEEITKKVQSGEIELHDDRQKAVDTAIPEPKAQPSVLSGRYGNEGQFNDTPLDRVKAVHNTAIGAGKSVIGTGYHVAKMLGMIDANPDFEKALESENTAQTVGKVAETVAEFAAGEGAVNAGLKLVPKVAKVAEIPVLGAGLKGAAVGAGTSVATGRPDDAKENAIIGGAAPAVLEGLGLLAKGAGAKILTSRIKPTAADRADGFKTETVVREGLGGMSLDDMLGAVKTKIGELADKAKTMRGNSAGAVDVLQLLTDTEQKLLSDPSNVTQLKGIQRVIADYTDNLSHFSQNGKMDPATANLVKSAVGKEGAFIQGKADPDATARELVANTLYPKLREAIEKNSGAGLGAINKRISELIPVERAIFRRLGQAGGEAPVGLLPFLALTAGKVGDVALALMQKSVGAGTALYKGGEAVAEAAPAAAPIALGIREGTRKRVGASGSY